MKDVKKSISKALIDRLLKILDEKGLTQYKLSQLSGVPFPTIKSIFQGRTENVSLKTIILLAYGLNMKPSELIDDDSFLAENLDLV